MSEFDVTTEMKMFAAIVMTSLVVIVMLLGLCFYKSKIAKPKKNVELN